MDKRACKPKIVIRISIALCVFDYAERASKVGGTKAQAHAYCIISNIK